MTLALRLPPQVESPLRRLDARWRLAALALAIILVAALKTLAGAALGLAGAALLLFYGRVPGRWYLSRLALLVPFLALLLLILPFSRQDAESVFRVGSLAYSLAGLRTASLIAVKAVAIVSLVCVLLTAAPLQDTFHAAHQLRVPGVFVLLLSLSYRYIFLFADEFAQLRIALRTRAYRNRPRLHNYRTIAHVVGALFIRGHERGERVSQAMMCRGFDGQFRSLAGFRTRPREVFFFAAVVTSGLLVLTADMLVAG